MANNILLIASRTTTNSKGNKGSLVSIHNSY
jgi:hypothetical protein